MEKQNKKEGRKIGGALYFVIIWLCLIIIQTLAGVISVLSGALDDPVIIIILLSSILFSISAIIVLILICKKKKAAIIPMIVLLVCNFGFFFISDIITKDYLSLTISFMFTTLFIVYFLISKRVKETFVK